MEFEGDSHKAEFNQQKHGVDFADAVGVLEDAWGLTVRSEIVDGEQRFVTIGSDFLSRILVVVYTFRLDRTRLISARRAMARERSLYEQKRS